MAHAKLSPSSAHRWSSCTASVSAQEGIADTSSDASKAGTARHLLSGVCLETGRDPQVWLGGVVEFDADGEEQLRTMPLGTDYLPVDSQFVDDCNVYVQFVRELVKSTGGELRVETKVPISHLTGETGATGTADAIILSPDGELIVVDAKFGRGKVDAYEEVVTGQHWNAALNNIEYVFESRPNKQLAMYASGALHHCDPVGLQFDKVRLVIVQPALSHVSEHAMSREKLDSFVKELSDKAVETRTRPVFIASRDNCHFCKALPRCEAAKRNALTEVFGGIEDLTAPREVATSELGTVFEKLDMIDDWCNAIRQQVRAELEQGRPVVGAQGPYKLVKGKAGDLDWVDAGRAVFELEVIHGFERGDLFEEKLTTPTKFKKLLKLRDLDQTLIDNLAERGPNARPQIVPASSSKPALDVTGGAIGFDDLTK